MAFSSLFEPWAAMICDSSTDSALGTGTLGALVLALGSDVNLRPAVVAGPACAVVPSTSPPSTAALATPPATIATRERLVLTGIYILPPGATLWAPGGIQAGPGDNKSTVARRMWIRPVNIGWPVGQARLVRRPAAQSARGNHYWQTTGRVIREAHETSTISHVRGSIRTMPPVP